MKCGLVGVALDLLTYSPRTGRERRVGAPLLRGAQVAADAGDSLSLTLSLSLSLSLTPTLTLTRTRTLTLTHTLTRAADHADFTPSRLADSTPNPTPNPNPNPTCPTPNSTCPTPNPTPSRLADTPDEELLRSRLVVEP